MPFDSGASAGRNLALSQVNTKYVVTLDDDFIFYDKTKLENWLNILGTTEIDLIGGNVAQHPRYHASLHIINNSLVFKPEPKGFENKISLWDICLQFWMAKTDSIRSFGGWDSDFKTVDHEIFFIRALDKIKITYCPDISINHGHINNTNYSQYRGRTEKYLNLLMDKIGVKRIIGLNGSVLYTYAD
jgi:hypothetical protein